MASSEGTLVIEWRQLPEDESEGSASFDWSISQAGDTLLADDEVEALLSEIAARV